MRNLVLFPTSRQYPSIDAQADRIVRHLDRVDVPSLSVKVDDYGLGLMVRRIDSIDGDVHLWFCRIQGNHGRLNDTAALNTLTIGKRSISVYEDYSGPSLRVYAGTDWERDRRTCWWGGCNTKLYGQPRKYLIYEDSDEKERKVRYGKGGMGYSSSFVYAGIAKYLLANNDLGREYDPVGDEPRLFTTQTVLDEMAAELSAYIDKIVEAYPDLGGYLVTCRACGEMSRSPSVPVFGEQIDCGSCGAKAMKPGGKKELS